MTTRKEEWSREALKTKSYRSLQALARETGISPLNVKTSVLIESLLTQSIIIKPAGKRMAVQGVLRHEKAKIKVKKRVGFTISDLSPKKAISSGNIEMVKTFLADGSFDVGELVPPVREKNTPLHIAVSSSPEMVRLILRELDKTLLFEDMIDAVNSKAQTPLMNALSRAVVSREKMKELREDGVSTKPEEARYEDALYITELLLDYSADPNHPVDCKPEEDSEEGHLCGDTPFLEAIDESMIDFVRLMFFGRVPASLTTLDTEGRDALERVLDVEKSPEKAEMVRLIVGEEIIRKNI